MISSQEKQKNHPFLLEENSLQNKKMREKERRTAMVLKFRLHDLLKTIFLYINTRYDFIALEALYEVVILLSFSL